MTDLALVNGHKTVEERVAKLEDVLMHLLSCLGVQLTKGPEGELGYRIPTMGPEEGWGLFAKILNDLGKIKNEKRIIIPGRN